MRVSQACSRECHGQLVSVSPSGAVSVHPHLLLLALCGPWAEGKCGFDAKPEGDAKERAHQPWVALNPF